MATKEQIKEKLSKFDTQDQLNMLFDFLITEERAKLFTERFPKLFNSPFKEGDVVTNGKHIYVVKRILTDGNFDLVFWKPEGDYHSDHHDPKVYNGIENIESDASYDDESEYDSYGVYYNMPSKDFHVVNEIRLVVMKDYFRNGKEKKSKYVALFTKFANPKHTERIVEEKTVPLNVVAYYAGY